MRKSIHRDWDLRGFKRGRRPSDDVGQRRQLTEAIPITVALSSYAYSPPTDIPPCVMRCRIRHDSGTFAEGATEDRSVNKYGI
jgi:hypothetical protein